MRRRWREEPNRRLSLSGASLAMIIQLTGRGIPAA